MTMRGVGVINEAEKQTEGVVMKYYGNGYMDWSGSTRGKEMLQRGWNRVRAKAGI